MPSTAEGSSPAGGEIPLRIRIGVTGHRDVEHPVLLGHVVDEVIGRIRARIPSGDGPPVELAVVSMLAEGADQIVARRVLAVPGATLEVPLPLEDADYLEDFTTTKGKADYAALLKRARLVVPPPASTSHEDAYERGGRFVVERCDVLVAVWDEHDARGRGGTATIVEHARELGVPMFVIRSTDLEIVEEPTGPIGAALVEEARHYNLGLDPAELHKTRRAVAADLLPANEVQVRALHLDAAVEWIAPYLARADRLAIRLRRQYDRGTVIIAIAGAVAVLTTALHAEIWPHLSALTALETLSTAVVAVQVWWGRKHRIHAHWVAYRFLAERFRSAFYLSLCDPGQRTEGGYDAPDQREPPDDWVRRAFAEVWDRRPPAPPERQAHHAAEFLAGSWLGDDGPGHGGQIAYHQHRCRSLERAHRRLSFGLIAVFGVVLACAAVHPFLPDDGRAAEWLTVASLSLPAVGAALAALGFDREYGRHAQRYEDTAKRLFVAREQFDGVTTSEGLSAVSALTEQIMLEETLDWVGVLRFHDFEP